MSNLSTYTFSEGKQLIRIINDDKGKFTTATGPLGLGTCAKDIRDGAKAPAKYNPAAILCDCLLIDENIAALCSDDSVYFEFTDKDEGYVYRGLVKDGTTVEYQNKRLEGVYGVLPFVLYALGNPSEERDENLKVKGFIELFHEIRDEYLANGTCELNNPLTFCDWFYYGVAKRTKGDIEILEDSLELATVQQAVKSGLLEPMRALEGIKCPEFTGISLGDKPTSKKSRLPDAEAWEAIKNKEFIVDFPWNASQKSRIPSFSLLNEFIPNSTYFSLISKIRTRLGNVQNRLGEGLEGIEAIGKDYVNLFITGKPGTGKTTVAYALGAALGLPTYTIAMTKNTEEDVFQGMNKVVDGGLKFVSTDFLDAYQNGGIIVLEEINLPDPSVVMGAIGQAVEFPFVLMRDGYVPVRRHPMCIIIGTMNIGTFGSKGVNQALSSRFRQSYILNDPSKDDFISILMKTGAKKQNCTWVYNAYDKITTYLKSPSVNAEDVCLNVTLRGCIGALENIEEGELGKEAIRNTLIGKISEVDLELANDVDKNVVSSLPELY